MIFQKPPPSLNAKYQNKLVHNQNNEVLVRSEVESLVETINGKYVKSATKNSGSLLNMNKANARNVSNNNSFNKKHSY